MNLSAFQSSKVFTKDELKLLHAVVRHEMPQQETWKFPPASLDFNERIVEALLFCEENKVNEAALTLTKGDCLVIDFNVRQDMKSPGGVMLGWNVLVKSFEARRDLAGGPVATASDEPVPEDIHEAMTEWEANVAALQEAKKTRRKRSA